MFLHVFLSSKFSPGSFRGSKTACGCLADNLQMIHHQMCTFAQWSFFTLAGEFANKSWALRKLIQTCKNYFSYSQQIVPRTTNKSIERHRLGCVACVCRVSSEKQLLQWQQNTHWEASSRMRKKGPGTDAFCFLRMSSALGIAILVAMFPACDLQPINGIEGFSLSVCFKGIRKVGAWGNQHNLIFHEETNRTSPSHRLACLGLLKVAFSQQGITSKLKIRLGLDFEKQKHLLLLVQLSDSCLVYCLFLLFFCLLLFSCWVSFFSKKG